MTGARPTAPSEGSARQRRAPRPRLWRALGAVAGAAVLLGLQPVVSAATSPAGGAVTPHGCESSPSTIWGGPVWTLGCHIGGQGFTSPVVGTIDGTKVVVDASLSGRVYVVNARTGKEMPGWPQWADLVGKRPTAIDSSPTIAYLDGPAKEPSIVVGLGSMYVKDQNGGVMAWNFNGTVRFRFHTKKTRLQWGKGPARYSNSVFATPAVGDITGNGTQDIIFGGFDHFVYALNSRGKVLKGFPINRQDTIWSSPALVDTTHTGKLNDIIEGGDANGREGCHGGWISDYRYLRGAPRLIWEHCLRETVWSSPAVADFGKTPVVVVGTSWYTGAGHHPKPDEDRVFAYDALTGRRMPGWPVNAGGPTFGSPAVAPVRSGASPEIIESSCAHCLHGPSIVTAWNERGRRLWRTHLTPHGQLLASPAVANVTNSVAGSPVNDVLIGNIGGLFVLNAATGDKVAGTGIEPVNPSCNVGGTPAVSEVPDSATGYMLFTSCGLKTEPGGGLVPVDEFLSGYDIPPPAEPPPWPMWRANPERTGVPDPVPAPRRACGGPSPEGGYRVLTAAGWLVGRDGSADCGDLADRLLPEDAVGGAATPDGRGYWVALADGAVYAFGDARVEGDLRGDSWSGGPGAPGPPVVSMAASGKGEGYYLLSGDGSVYAFGDARYHGSDGVYRGHGVPVGIASDPATGGYWVVDSTGRVEAFDAPHYGSRRHRGIVGIASLPNGEGYWLVSATGSVYAFGRARALGAAHARRIVGIAAARSGRGYYLVSKDGTVYGFGKVPRAASVVRAARRAPVVAIVTP